MRLSPGGIALPDVQFNVQSKVSGTVSGTADDFTLTDFGGPKASLAAMFGTTALGTILANGSGSLGLTDMTTHGCAGWYAEDGNATSDTQSMTRNSFAVSTNDADGILSLSEATASQITDGVRYTWNKSDDLVAFVLGNLMFTGAALTAKCDNIAGTIADDGTVETGLEFQPDVIILICTDANSATAPALHSKVGIGFCDASLNQGCVWYREFSALNPSKTNAMCSDNRTLVTRVGSDNLGIEVTAIGSSSFTITARNESAADWTPDITYLALKLEASTDAKVGFHTLPNDTGVKTITGVGFKPRLVLQLDSAEAVYGNTVDSADGLIGLSLLNDIAGQQLSGGTASADAVDPSDTGNTMKNVAIWYPGFGGTSTLYEGSAYTPTADGYSINYGKASSSTHKGLYLALR